MSVAGDGHARVTPVSQQAAGDKEGCRERLNERVAGGREKRERATHREKQLIHHQE